MTLGDLMTGGSHAQWNVILINNITRLVTW
jgi:hypothetical protein